MTLRSASEYMHLFLIRKVLDVLLWKGELDDSDVRLAFVDLHAHAWALLAKPSQRGWRARGERGREREREREGEREIMINCQFNTHLNTEAHEKLR